MRSTAATPPAAAKKVTKHAENRTGAAATAAAAATARPSGLRRAAKPTSSTDHQKIPRARAGIALKKQALRRDPRGRILLRGSPGFESAGETRVPTIEPPPGRLVGSVDRAARPRGRPFIGRENIIINSNTHRADRENIRQTGGGGNEIDSDGSRFGGREVVGDAEPPPKEGGASATIEQVTTQQQLPQKYDTNARILGGGGSAGEGEDYGCSTLALTANGAETGGAGKKIQAPPEEIEIRQARGLTQEQERERERDGDASDTEEDESLAQQPHQQDVSRDWGEYVRRKTNQNLSDTDESPPATAADSSGEVEEETLPAVPPDEPNHEKQKAEEVVGTALGSSVAPASGGG